MSCSFYRGISCDGFCGSGIRQEDYFKRGQKRHIESKEGEDKESYLEEQEQEDCYGQQKGESEGEICREYKDYGKGYFEEWEKVY